MNKSWLKNYFKIAKQIWNNYYLDIHITNIWTIIFPNPMVMLLNLKNLHLIIFLEH